MNFNFRTFGKVGFILAFIGFFMPIACDMNAFQLTEYLETPSVVLLYGLFILAIAGIIIGVLLLMNKNIPVVADWVVILLCTGVGIYLLSTNELELQSGAYFIIIGFIIALIAQIISVIRKEM